MNSAHPLSLNLAAARAARRVAILIASFGAGLLLVICVFGTIFGLYQRNTAAVRAMTPYLVQLLKSNDVFDATRQLNSLIASGDFSRYWLADGRTGQIRFSGTNGATSAAGTPSINRREGWTVDVLDGIPSLTASYGISGIDGDLRLIVAAPVPLVPIFAVTGCLLASSFGVYWLIRRRMIGLADQISAPIQSFAAALKNHDPDKGQSFTIPKNVNGYLEFIEMGSQFDSLLSRLKASETKRIAVEKDAALANQARETAHHLKSPVLALELGVKTLEGVPEKSRIILQTAAASIKNITNKLMEKYEELYGGGALSAKDLRALAAQMSYSSVRGFRTSCHLLSTLIDGVVTERSLQHQNRSALKIETCIGQDAWGFFATIDPVEFRSLLSNLINNSVEAIEDAGRVTVSLQQFPGKFAEIIVSDNGKGIAADVLPQLMKKGASFDKKGGQGIGLYHARKAIEAWDGTIRIESEAGRGTRVVMLVPLAQQPAWFLPELKIEADARVVVVDDDSSIHEVWKERLAGHELEHYRTPDAFIKAERARDQSYKKVQYLIDYEFLGHDKNGLDLIEELGIRDRAVLVTSHFGDRQVVDDCERLRVRVIPKALAGMVRMTA